MLSYLDNCCYNRPFDEPSQVRIVNEANAKMAIQRAIANGKLDLVLTYILYSDVYSAGDSGFFRDIRRLSQNHQFSRKFPENSIVFDPFSSVLYTICKASARMVPWSQYHILPMPINILAIYILYKLKLIKNYNC